MGYSFLTHQLLPFCGIVIASGLIAFVCMIVRALWSFVWSFFVKPEPKINEKVLIMLGSGGHTSEILKLMRTLSISYFFPRVYISTDTDSFSLGKAFQQEMDLPRGTRFPLEANEFLAIPRIREVGDSLFKALYKAPLCFLMSGIVLWQHQPDLILCNGPGVCVPICVLAYLFNKLNITATRIVFVESICRIQSLSVTGKFMVYIANSIIVQWEELLQSCREKYPKANIKYLGRLV